MVDRVKSALVSRRELFGLGAVSLAGLVASRRAMGQAAELAPAEEVVDAVTEGAVDAVVEEPIGLPQGAGYYRFGVGDLEVGLLGDGNFVAPAATFAVNALSDEVAAEARRRFGDPEGMVCHVNGLVVKSADEVVLIDTGAGGNFGDTTGKLVRHLTHFGVRPEDVTTVVFTHLHVDHCGGIVGGAGGGVFPNAEYVVTRAEAEFWEGDADLSGSPIPAGMHGFFVDMARKALASAGDRLRLIEPGNGITGSVSSVALPGHTAGHIGVMVDSGGETLYFIADAIHNAKIQMAHPDWHVAFDADPVMAAKMRRRALDRAAAERLMVAGSHLPFPGVGHVRAEGSGYAWEPVGWMW
ncbi:MBL fold metallo-hydrolase [Mucisphaera sp.]|uniref:MBL fold metallo-hydrolase n=1 Tax=Mucisphaera sp. TaxID=2913024 RepID=UPI003D10C5BD